MCSRIRGTFAILIALGLASATGCTTVSGSGRSQLNMLSASEERSLGEQAYAQELSGAKVVTSGPDYERVQRVSRRIFESANRNHAIARTFRWDVVLIDQPKTVNAWALPGGKCAVYSGLLRVADTDDMLAVVMGHECAHATSRHSGERITQQVLGETLANTAFVLADMPPAGQQAVMAGLGLGGLAFSRSHESEADEIGLIISADAGYDPRAAITLWQRMDAASPGSIEFLSTHPKESTRIARLQRIMPAAMRAYEARVQTSTPGAS
jgi:predicted Zn-dependent protease